MEKIMSKMINFEGLTTLEAIKQLKEVKLGQWHAFVSKKVDEKTGYSRITIASGRLCDYEATAVVKEMRANGQPRRATNNGNSIVSVIDNVLYYFTNTGNYNLSVKSTGKKGKTSSTKYYDNHGKEITKSEYEQFVKLEKHNISNVWYINLKNLVAIK